MPLAGPPARPSPSPGRPAPPGRQPGIRSGTTWGSLVSQGVLVALSCIALDHTQEKSPLIRPARQEFRTMLSAFDLVPPEKLVLDRSSSPQSPHFRQESTDVPGVGTILLAVGPQQ